MSFFGAGHIPPEVLADLCRHPNGYQLARARAHLEECERCRNAQERVMAGLATMDQIAEQEAPDLAWDHIGARIYWNTSSERRASGRSDARAAWLRYGLLGVSAAALVAVVALWAVRSSDSAAPVATTPAPTPEIVLAPEIAPTLQKRLPSPISAAVVFTQGTILASGESLNPDDPVLAGVKYATGNGRLVVQFGANSAFRVSPNSTLTIDRLDSERIALRVDGQVDVDITRRLPGQEFSVVAGHHEVVVRGTAFRVDYVDGELGVQCIRGKVVVTDGDHGVHVPAGQRFQVLRDALDDAALRALPIDTQALEELGRAMEMPMLPRWDSTVLTGSSGLIEVDSMSEVGIAVDGSYVADGSFVLRTTIGDHEVALVDGDGGLSKKRVVKAGAGGHIRALMEPPSRPSLAGRTTRKRQLQTAMQDSPRATRCLARLSKQGLLKGSYLVLDVGVNEDGSQSHLNLLDSNLSPAIQACLRDVVDAQELPSGPQASFRFRLSY